jgi:hypothetical protein
MFSGFSAILLSASSAHAADRLSFDGKIGDTSRFALGQYLQASNKTTDDMLIAAADLNGDGLNEFIIRDKNCDSSSKNCTFTVLSEVNDMILPLGDIPARDIALGNQYSQGVRSLVAYESVINDYEYAVYVWEPSEARYMMAGQK